MTKEFFKKCVKSSHVFKTPTNTLTIAAIVVFALCGLLIAVAIVAYFIRKRSERTIPLIFCKAARNGIGMVGMGMARKNTGMAGMEILDLHSEAKFPFQKAQFSTKFT